MSLQRQTGPGRCSCARWYLCKRALQYLFECQRASYAATCVHVEFLMHFYRVVSPFSIGARGQKSKKDRRSALRAITWASSAVDGPDLLGQGYCFRFRWRCHASASARIRRFRSPQSQAFWHWARPLQHVLSLARRVLSLARRVRSSKPVERGFLLALVMQ